MGSEVSCPIGLCSSLLSQASPVGSWVFTGLVSLGMAGAKVTMLGGTQGLVFCMAGQMSLRASFCEHPKVGDGQEVFSERQRAACWPFQGPAE